MFISGLDFTKRIYRTNSNSTEKWMFKWKCYIWFQCNRIFCPYQFWQQTTLIKTDIQSLEIVNFIWPLAFNQIDQLMRIDEWIDQTNSMNHVFVGKLLFKLILKYWKLLTDESYILAKMKLRSVSTTALVVFIVVFVDVRAF